MALRRRRFISQGDTVSTSVDLIPVGMSVALPLLLGGVAIVLWVLLECSGRNSPSRPAGPRVSLSSSVNLVTNVTLEAVCVSVSSSAGKLHTGSSSTGTSACPGPLGRWAAHWAAAFSVCVTWHVRKQRHHA